MRTDQFYDKMISRMDKMEVTLGKILKTIQAMQPEPEPRTLSDAPLSGYQQETFKAINHPTLNV